MIKAIILDVDGVIVGQTPGVNFPYPGPPIINKLKAIRQKGIAISLCTSKPYYSVEKIIIDAGLNNMHISLAGGLIIDPIDNKTLAMNPIDKVLAKTAIKTFLDKNIYTELYAADNYYLQATQANELTALHAEILQKKPILVESLADAADLVETLKIMPICDNQAGMHEVEKYFQPFLADLILSWAIHPSANPHKFANITTKGISKKQAATELAKNLGIDTEEILGVGDGVSDWQFMELCGYAAAMGNASDELKNLVKTKKGNSYIGASVEQDGILDIFDHYEI